MALDHLEESFCFFGRKILYFLSRSEIFLQPFLIEKSIDVNILIFLAYVIKVSPDIYYTESVYMFKCI